MSDSSLTIQNLLTAEALRQPVLQEVMRALQLPPAGRGLDAGCGIGLQALMLAQETGPQGRVTGLDIDLAQLAWGHDRVRRAGYPDRITFCQGDIGRLPFARHSFDWAWSADCIGYPAGDLRPLLGELMRVVRPGGSIFLLGWSAQQLLPGHPFLEARLNATCSAYLPYMQAKAPETNFLRAIGQMRQAGLAQVQAQTFVGQVQAPLSEDQRLALASLFEMLWGQPQPEVSAQDWEAYHRLCEPASPDFILNVDGYYAFFTYTLFRGKVR
jgi:demethylmenaquinone methyltransferase/2-methoxy-6-polyprenyl-1,4-benzoquinol methylase